jgi:hypothetical protein
VDPPRPRTATLDVMCGEPGKILQTGASYRAVRISPEAIHSAATGPVAERVHGSGPSEGVRQLRLRGDDIDELLSDLAGGGAGSAGPYLAHVDQVPTGRHFGSRSALHPVLARPGTLADRRSRLP